MNQNYLDNSKIVTFIQNSFLCNLEFKEPYSNALIVELSNKNR